MQEDETEGISPLIDLWSETFGLILLCNSGVRYSNQTGGYACLHPQEEGVFAPLPAEPLEDAQTQERIKQYFVGEKWNGWCFEGIDEETADFLDSAFAQCELMSGLSVDRTRLQSSHEAWIYVLVKEPDPIREGEWESVPFAGFGPCRAVLIWLNSD